MIFKKNVGFCMQIVSKARQLHLTPCPYKDLLFLPRTAAGALAVIAWVAEVATAAIVAVSIWVKFTIIFINCVTFYQFLWWVAVKMGNPKTMKKNTIGVKHFFVWFLEPVQLTSLNITIKSWQWCDSHWPNY